MANSAAIKGALLQTKATKTADHLMKPPEHTADDEKWIKRVIKQEHIRPLNVRATPTDDFDPDLYCQPHTAAAVCTVCRP